MKIFLDPAPLFFSSLWTWNWIIVSSSIPREDLIKAPIAITSDITTQYQNIYEEKHLFLISKHLTKQAFVLLLTPLSSLASASQTPSLSPCFQKISFKFLFTKNAQSNDQIQFTKR